MEAGSGVFDAHRSAFSPRVGSAYSGGPLRCLTGGWPSCNLAMLGRILVRENGTYLPFCVRFWVLRKRKGRNKFSGFLCSRGSGTPGSLRPLWCYRNNEIMGGTRDVLWTGTLTSIAGLLTMGVVFRELLGAPSHGVLRCSRVGTFCHGRIKGTALETAPRHSRHPHDRAQDGLRGEGLQRDLDLGGRQDHDPAGAPGLVFFKVVLFEGWLTFWAAPF